jgi:hypothetical protein
MKETQKTQPTTPDDDGSRYRKNAIPLYSDEAGRLYRDKALTEVTDPNIVRTPHRGAQIYWVKPVPESDRVRACEGTLLSHPQHGCVNSRRRSGWIRTADPRRSRRGTSSKTQRALNGSLAFPCRRRNNRHSRRRARSLSFEGTACLVARPGIRRKLAAPTT